MTKIKLILNLIHLLNSFFYSDYYYKINRRIHSNFSLFSIFKNKFFYNQIFILLKKELYNIL